MTFTNASNSNEKVNPVHYKLVNLLSKFEYEVVKNSINEKDLYLLTVINSNNVIQESHNRYSKCKEIKVEPQFEVKKFEDPLDKKNFIIKTNLKKRQLNDFQKYELIYLLEKIDQKEERCKESFIKEDLKKKTFKNKDLL